MYKITVLDSHAVKVSKLPIGAHFLGGVNEKRVAFDEDSHTEVFVKTATLLAVALYDGHTWNLGSDPHVVPVKILNINLRYV